MAEYAILRFGLQYPSYPWLCAQVYSTADKHVIRTFEEYRRLPHSDWRFGIDNLESDFLDALPSGNSNLEFIDSGIIGFSFYFGSPEGRGCWPICEYIKPGSPADSAGLHTGDVVLQADSISLAHPDPSTLRRALSGPVGRLITLSVWRCEQGVVPISVKMAPRYISNQ